LTGRNYLAVLSNSSAQASFVNTMLLSVVVATTAVGLTAGAAWLIVRTDVGHRSLLDYLISVTLVFPGLVLGVAMVRTYLIIPLPVYGTVWLLAIAYLTRFAAVAMRYVHPGLLQLHRELEESARMAGASWLSMTAKILVPLMSPALIAAWIWVFLSCV